jgi:ribonuclease-3
MNERKLQQLQDLLGYHFKNKDILIEAFTHASVASDRLVSNERLEFLGDSVLALVICKQLFDQFPDYLEGDLTKIKSMLVSRKTCASVVNELNFTDFAKLGKGMEATKAVSGSIAAGILEAVIAAIYIDGGFDAAKEFILRLFDPLIENVDAEHHHENFKSLLQQSAQQMFAATPIYEKLDEKGPDHNKCFEMTATIGNKRFPSAW